MPETGGAILASNHLSFSDSSSCRWSLPRRVTFLAKAEYFTGRGLKGRLHAAFFTGAGQVPDRPLRRRRPPRPRCRPA